MTLNAISACPKPQPLNLPVISTVGLLAGQGELPCKIIDQCHQQGQRLFLIAFEGQTAPALVADASSKGYASCWLKLGAVEEILKSLKAYNVTHIVMAGSLRRPSWSELKLDWLGRKWLLKMGLKIFGDDALLKSALSLLKAEGFEILSTSDILPDFLAHEGVMGLHHPQASDWEDIYRGQDVGHLLGQADVGQSVVVQQGLILGVEAIEGTAALLARCGLLRRSGEGGVLVKIAKPHQSQAVDLPTIGRETVHQAQAAGLGGIAVEAGTTQLLDKADVIKAADGAGMYLVGVKRRA